MTIKPCVRALSVCHKRCPEGPECCSGPKQTAAAPGGGGGDGAPVASADAISLGHADSETSTHRERGSDAEKLLELLVQVLTAVRARPLHARDFEPIAII